MLTLKQLVLCVAFVVVSSTFHSSANEGDICAKVRNQFHDNDYRDHILTIGLFSPQHLSIVTNSFEVYEIVQVNSLDSNRQSLNVASMLVTSVQDKWSPLSSNDRLQSLAKKETILSIVIRRDVLRHELWFATKTTNVTYEVLVYGVEQKKVQQLTLNFGHHVHLVQNATEKWISSYEMDTFYSLITDDYGVKLVKFVIISNELAIRVKSAFSYRLCKTAWPNRYLQVFPSESARCIGQLTVPKWNVHHGLVTDQVIFLFTSDGVISFDRALISGTQLKTQITSANYHEFISCDTAKNARLRINSNEDNSTSLSHRLKTSVIILLVVLAMIIVVVLTAWAICLWVNREAPPFESSASSAKLTSNWSILNPNLRGVTERSKRNSGGQADQGNQSTSAAAAEFSGQQSSKKDQMEQ